MFHLQHLLRLCRLQLSPSGLLGVHNAAGWQGCSSWGYRHTVPLFRHSASLWHPHNYRDRIGRLGKLPSSSFWPTPCSTSWAEEATVQSSTEAKWANDLKVLRLRLGSLWAELTWLQSIIDNVHDSHMQHLQVILPRDWPCVIDKCLHVVHAKQVFSYQCSTNMQDHAPLVGVCPFDTGSILTHEQMTTKDSRILIVLHLLQQEVT